MDRKIKCQDCGEEFNFSEEKGFKPPKRWKNCRAIKKDRMMNEKGGYNYGK